MSTRQRAVAGEVIPVMIAAAEYEGMAPEVLCRKVASGQVAIPANRHRKFPQIRAVGQGMRVKVNANLGTSPHCCDPEMEIRKLTAAVASGVDAVMDLSLGKNLSEMRQEILRRSPVMVGTVPIYEAAAVLAEQGRDITELSTSGFLQVVEKQAREGVDFMTIHCGITRRSLETLDRSKRRLGVVSRGGSFMVSWLQHNQGESPLYAGFDELLAILAEHEVTLSLGDGMRPGATLDATDQVQLEELYLLGELTQRAWDKGVQVIVEGPGHVPLNQVEENVRLQKRLCHGAPFYVLGPLVTDIAAGHDHIAGAIGGAVAAMAGADFLCYVTPAEHLRLPSVNDVVEGVIASRIAAQAADLARGREYAVAREEEMASARLRLDWQQQIDCCLHREKAAAYRQESGIGEEEVCTMCGEFCAIKRLRGVKGEEGE